MPVTFRQTKHISKSHRRANRDDCLGIGHFLGERGDEKRRFTHGQEERDRAQEQQQAHVEAAYDKNENEQDIEDRQQLYHAFIGASELK